MDATLPHQTQLPLNITSCPTFSPTTDKPQKTTLQSTPHDTIPLLQHLLDIHKTCNNFANPTANALHQPNKRNDKQHHHQHQIMLYILFITTGTPGGLGTTMVDHINHTQPTTGHHHRKHPHCNQTQR
jgi:hypothetical protein